MFCSQTYASIGDSGGPIFQWTGNRWQQVGLTSYGPRDCNFDSQAAVFVRLVSYYDWIDSILSKHAQVLPGIPEGSPARALGAYQCNRTAVTCGCSQLGAAFKPTKIIGGEEAVPHSWSMIVSIRRLGSDQHWCSGTILNASFILTAANCVDGSDPTYPKGMTVAAGMHSRSNLQKMIRFVDRIYKHPFWNASASPLNHDIAILHLSKPLDFQSNISIVRTCVAQNNQSTLVSHYPANNSQIVAIGWGSTEPFSSSYSDVLRQVTLNVFDNADPNCQRLTNDANTQLCAGTYQSEQGTYPTNCHFFQQNFKQHILYSRRVLRYV